VDPIQLAYTSMSTGWLKLTASAFHLPQPHYNAKLTVSSPAVKKETIASTHLAYPGGMARLSGLGGRPAKGGHQYRYSIWDSRGFPRTMAT